MIDFVMIGANIGNTDNDPVWPELLKNPETRAYLIEPNPKAYKKLVENCQPFPNVKCFDFAVGNKDEEVFLYVDNYENSDGLSQHASCVEDQVLFDHAEDEFKPTKIKCQQLTLETFLKNESISNEKIRTLVIDTEGYDYSIIKSINFDLVNVDNVLFEYCHVGGPHARDQDKIREIYLYLLSFRFEVKLVNSENALAYR